MQGPSDEFVNSDFEHQKKYLEMVWAHLEKFSPARFDAYSRSYRSESACLASFYFWNKSVSAALLPTLLASEMLLKNAVDLVMVKKHGALWFDAPGLLEQREVEYVEKARQKAAKKEKARGRSTNHDDIVVELSFRFWTNLLMSDYSRSIWNHLLVYNAFPGLPCNTGDRRSMVRRVFNDACDIRNRVCHGERVIHLPNLEGRHKEIVGAVKWVSNPYWQILRKSDTFPELWAAGPKASHDLLVSLVRPRT